MTMEKNIKNIASHLKSSPDAKVTFLVGAGISTSCGIPDFRSPKTGLYHNLSKLKLPFAEAVFDIEFFEKNPEPFYTLAKELYPGNFKPTRFHYLMKLFEQKGRLNKIYTQNIDTLELEAGISTEKIIEAHGNFAANHCIKCKKKFEQKVFKDRLNISDPKNSDKNKPQFDYAKCDKCDGLIKPNIVFFGENLPERFFSKWDEDVNSFEIDEKRSNDMVIVAGTSLTVFPFAALPSEVPENITRALFNLEAVGDFKSDARKSDVIVKAPLDTIASKFAEELGWSTELKELMVSENAIADLVDDLEKLEIKVEKTDEKIKKDIEKVPKEKKIEK